MSTRGIHQKAGIPSFCTECQKKISGQATTCSPTCRTRRWRRLKAGGKDLRGYSHNLGPRERRSVREFFSQVSGISWPPEMEKRRFEDIARGRSKVIQHTELRALEAWYPGIRGVLERS